MTRAGDGGVISLHTAHLVEEAIKTMFVTRIRIGVAAAFLAGCLAIGAAGVFARQGPGAETGQGAKPSGTLARVPTSSLELAPSHIQQSRKMIIERLEQELAHARDRRDQYSSQIRSGKSNDPVLLHLRRTADKLAAAMGRIDAALVEAVDEFPTTFDFTTIQAPAPEKPASAQVGKPDEPTHTDVFVVNQPLDAGQKRRARPSASPPATPSEKLVDPAAGPAYDEYSLAKAAEKLQWSAKMLEKGYVSKAQHDEYQKLYESLKARIEADIARGKDRVDWARRMHEKGYVSKEQYDAEILKHYNALKAHMAKPAVSDDLRARYDELTRLYATNPNDPTQPAKPSTPGAKPQDGPRPKQ